MAANDDNDKLRSKFEGELLTWLTTRGPALETGVETLTAEFRLYRLSQETNMKILTDSISSWTTFKTKLWAGAFVISFLVSCVVGAATLYLQFQAVVHPFLPTNERADR